MKQGSQSKVPCLVQSLLKKETRSYEDSSFTMSTSLKNEIGSYEHSYFPMSSLLKNETNSLSIRVFD